MHNQLWYALRSSGAFGALAKIHVYGGAGRLVSPHSLIAALHVFSVCYLIKIDKCMSVCLYHMIVIERDIAI
jgi:hypothetical protein